MALDRATPHSVYKGQIHVCAAHQRMRQGRRVWLTGARRWHGKAAASRVSTAGLHVAKARRRWTARLLLRSVNGYAKGKVLCSALRLP